MTEPLFIDIEVRSPTSIKHGVYAHADDPDAELLLVAYALGREPVRQWSPAEGEPVPADLHKALTYHPALRAQNAAYERTVLASKYSQDLRDPDIWRCDMVGALYKSLPGSLDKLGEIVGLPADKRKLAEGKRLVKLFCMPRKPTKNKPWMWADHTNEPDKWALFKEYNRQDVETQRAIHYKLNRWPLPDTEQRIWELDQRINDRGLPIDMDLVRGAISVAETQFTQLTEQLVSLTGLANPNSVQQLLGWLSSEGIEMPNLQKATVIKTLQDPSVTGTPRKVLEIRQTIAKASNKKYNALVNAVSPDNRLRGTFQFYGANRTGRWTGKIFQPHNLPRGYSDPKEIQLVRDLLAGKDPQNLLGLLTDDDPLTAMSKVLRACVRAPKGYHLDVADLNAIENRVLGWIARCQSILDVHNNGLCPYKSFAAHWFRLPYDAITKAMRTLAKPPVLGCGYMLSAGLEIETEDGNIELTGLRAYADSMGVTMDEDEAREAVDLFRTSYPEIPILWDELDQAFRDTIRSRRSNRVGYVTFHYDKPFVVIELPNKRCLFYHDARILPRVPPWEWDKPNPKTRPTITYMGQHQQTKNWVRITTHPGKITENIVQAIARDVLAEGLLAADAMGFEIIGHVHDEIIACTPDGSPLTVRDLCDCMSRPLVWAPGLPLKAEGFQTVMYRKD